jgi:hypothetical protein
MKQRREAKAEKKQRQNKERTKKEQRNAAHFLTDYQPLKRTNRTPKKGIYSRLFTLYKKGSFNSSKNITRARKSKVEEIRE